jgi:hypothetical protein
MKVSVQDKPQEVFPWQWLCFGDSDDNIELRMIENLERQVWRKE